MESLPYYLDEIDSRIRRMVSNSSNFKVFFNKLKRANLKLDHSRQIKEDQAKLESYKDIINTILSIISHPHLSIKMEDIIIRSETVSSIDTQSFLKTLEEAKLRKRKNGRMTPERVYSYENIDNLRIYENIFIVMLIDYLYGEIDSLMKSYEGRFGSLYNYSGTSKLSYENYGVFSRLERANEKDSEILTQNKEREVFLYKEIVKLEKKLRQVRATNFYVDVKKARPIKGTIQPTNILLKDNLYSECYRFYLDHVNIVEEKKKRDLYTNYIFVSLSKGLIDLGYKLAPISKRRNRRIKLKDSISLTKTLYFYNDSFSIGLIDDDVYGGIKVKVKLNKVGFRKLKKEEVTESYILPLIRLDSFSLGESKEAIEKIADSGVARVTLCLLESNTLENRSGLDILNYSTYRVKGQEDAMKNLLISYTTLLKGSRGIYESHCPVCGGSLLLNDDKIYRCLECNSTYSLYNAGKVGYIRIRSLYGGDKNG
jgi:hypothetical protein